MFAKTIVASYQSPPELKAIADFVCDGTNDHLDIQAAVDVGRDAYCLPGPYRIFGTITVKPGVHLELAQNTVFWVGADVDAVYISKNARLSGGRISSSGFRPYNHALVLFNGLERYMPTWGMVQGLTGVSGITLQLDGSYWDGGAGIRFVADSPDSAGWASSVRMQNLQISGGLYGIWIDIPVPDSDAKPHFFNSNMLTDIYIEHSVYGIYAPGPGSIAGNMFQGIHYQSNARSRRFIYINSHNNIFNNVIPWDWAVAEPVIEFGPNGKQNLVVGPFGGRKILDRSVDQSNVLHDTGRQTTDKSFNNGNLVTTWP